MKYRIVISPDPNGGLDWRVAINTEQGTMQDSLVIVRNMLKVLAVIEGYLQLFKGEIEIHPNRSAGFYEMIKNEVALWKRTLDA